MTTIHETRPGRDLNRRLLYLGLFMAAALLVVTVRLYRLQITQHDEYAAKGEANFVRDVRVAADRGFIKDALGTILVENRASFDVHVTPAFCRECSEKVLPQLASVLGWDEAQRLRVDNLLVAARRRAPYQPVPVQIDLTRAQVDALGGYSSLSAMGDDQLPGVTVAPVQHRHYLTGQVLSHALGYMSEINQDELERLNAEGASYSLGDYIGRRGLERYFESTLRGADGYKKEVVDAKGRTVRRFEGPGAELEAVAGGNVVLSLDMRLQEEAERIFPGAAGAVIVVEVKTGYIRALVSRPGFDPNLLTGRITAGQMNALSMDPMQPMVNRVTAEHYSPGSTFKVVTSLAAWKSGLFTPASTVYCPGSYHLGARAWRCDKESGHGYLNGRQAIQMSCNVYFYRIADQLGLDAIAEMAQSLGLGRPTGVLGLAEVPGIMPTSKYHDERTPGGYTKGMALNSAIGQGEVNVTPLQLAMLYTAIANGGTLFKPLLVHHVEDSDGKVLQRFEPEVVRQVPLPKEHRAAVVDALLAVVNEAGGTAYAKRPKDVLVAGKTGTAQVVRLGKVRLKAYQIDYFQRDHAWFASFAPADAPEIAVVVLNEHAGFGASGAAPTAMAVIQKYFELKKQDAEHPPAHPSKPYERPAQATVEPGGPAAAAGLPRE